MNRKTALWLAVTALVVLASALLPEAALYVQDARLEGSVRTQEVEAVDLSLLAELSPEDTLYLAQTYQSRVALEQGRQMTGAQAGRAAQEMLAEVFGWDNNAIDLAVTDAVPWLYVGEGGESVILWETDLTGQSENPVRTMAGLSYDPACPAEAMALVDERSGQVVSVKMHWSAPEEPIPTSEPAPSMPDPDPYEAEYPGEEPESIYLDLSAYMRGVLLWVSAARLGLRDGMDDLQWTDEGWTSCLDLTTDSGTAFSVPAEWDLDGMSFN